MRPPLRRQIEVRIAQVKGTQSAVFTGEPVEIRG
jgi:hypothetical protein